MLRTAGLEATKAHRIKAVALVPQSEGNWRNEFLELAAPQARRLSRAVYVTESRPIASMILGQ